MPITDAERNSLKNRPTPPHRVVPIPSDGRIQVEALRNHVNDLAASDYVIIEREAAPVDADAPKKGGRPKKGA